MRITGGLSPHSPRPTVKDVAVLARVSPKTVSNVLGGSITVASETRARVEEAIDRLRYVPNLAARGLRSGRTGVIALVVPDLRTPFSAELTQYVVELAHERGVGVQLEQTWIHPSRTREPTGTDRRHLVDGVILCPITVAERDDALGDGVGVPLVILGEFPQEDVDQVSVDNVDAARRITRFLIDEGHRRIAMLGVPNPQAGNLLGRLRQEGYRAALVESGIPVVPELERTCDIWSPYGGFRAMTSLLEEVGVPDAVFCASDSVAIGALSALRSADLRVPEDVSVVGIEDIDDAACTSPRLTTLRIDKKALARTALERLILRIGGSTAPSESIILPTEILVRASTCQRTSRFRP